MRRVEIEEFLELVEGGKMGFDVRTPAEFEKGHLPGVKNLPLFTDEERVVVGTLYKQEGRREALLEGLGFVGPRMREMVEAVEGIVGPPEEGKEVLVHCWRGGMRSSSTAWLLELYGYEVVLLEGGYKSFRRYVLEEIDSPPPMRVIGGPTGVGKTEILHELRQMGEPVIDLEGLANHRGSAFGAHLLPAQPAQQHFENLLGMEIRKVRRAGRAVWVEDESRMIGMRHLPKPVMMAIKEGEVFLVEASVEERVERLVEVYGDASREDLRESFERIEKSLGGVRTKEAKEALEKGDLAGAARLALEYYDKAYGKGISRRDPETIHSVDLKGKSAEIARCLVELGRKFDIQEQEG